MMFQFTKYIFQMHDSCFVYMYSLVWFGGKTKLSFYSIPCFLDILFGGMFYYFIEFNAMCNPNPNMINDNYQNMNILLWAPGKIEHWFGIYGHPITLEYEIETIML